MGTARTSDVSSFRVGPGFGRRTFRKRGFFRVEPERGGASRPSGVETGKDRGGAETEGNALTAWKRTRWEFGGGAVFSASARRCRRAHYFRLTSDQDQMTRPTMHFCQSPSKSSMRLSTRGGLSAALSE